MSDKIDVALDRILNKPSLSEELSLKCAKIKELEDKLKRVEFIHREGTQILLEVDANHRIGYDFVKRRIICMIVEDDMVRIVCSKPLLEHTWPVRQEMFEHIHELLAVLEQIK